MGVKLNQKVLKYVEELQNHNNERALRAQEALVQGNYEIEIEHSDEKIVAKVHKKESSSTYKVEIGPSYSRCTCKDATVRHVVCKHQYMVALHLKELQNKKEVAVYRTSDKLTEELANKKFLQPIRYRVDGRWHV